ncbi:MAG: hypothetical protein K6357_04030 [Elusimicrobiota bacterium]
MKKNKLITKLIRNTKKLARFKNSITPTKVFYVWDRNNFTKIETFSL